ACVDRFYDDDGACGKTPHPVFPHFTALPSPNDYQSLCGTDGTVCTHTGHVVRLAADEEGNLLLPMGWAGLLVDPAAVPVARLLRGSTPVAAFAGHPTPIRLLDPAALGSFSPEGGKLPPVFDPQAGQNDGAGATLFGSADAPTTVLRVARHPSVLD